MAKQGGTARERKSTGKQSKNSRQGPLIPSEQIDGSIVLLRGEKVLLDADLRRHFGTSSSWGGRRYPPYAFTDQGVAMLSSVLRSKRAVQVNIEIVRAFVRLRRLLATNEKLSRKLDTLEQKYDVQFKIVFDAIRELMRPPETSEKRGRIGFHRKQEK